MIISNVLLKLYKDKKSAQLKYGEKKVSPSGVVKSGIRREVGQVFLKGRASSGIFAGPCDGVKGYIFDYGALGHPC